VNHSSLASVFGSLSTTTIMLLRKKGYFHTI
jgi:hypothetical protein